VLGPKEEDGRNNIVESLIIFSWYNKAKIIKSRELDRQNMQTNWDDGGANGISLGKRLENTQKYI
jgi:hypothetical protein